jgi:ADP-ribose pyrophosphatase YjhB (NUDIX family)
MDLFGLLDELRTIARNGLTYSSSPYDQERYGRLLDLASQHYGAALDLPAPEVRARLSAELGYITPKVGASAGIFDDEGRILLVRRADDNTWCLPCGWIEPGEQPADAAVREIREETGLEARVVHLIDAIGRPAKNTTPHGLVTILFLCEAIGGTLAGSHEGEEVRYWPLDEVPVWHAQHQIYAQKTRAAWQASRVAV